MDLAQRFRHLASVICYIAHAPEALVRQIGLTQSDSEAKQKQDRQRAYHRRRRQEAFVLLTSQAEVNPERGDTNTGSDRSLFIVFFFFLLLDFLAINQRHVAKVIKPVDPIHAFSL